MEGERDRFQEREMVLIILRTSDMSRTDDEHSNEGKENAENNDDDVLDRETHGAAETA